MKKNYEIIKCDENVIENKNFYFTLKQNNIVEPDRDSYEIEFYISPFGMIFHVVDDKRSVTLGLRDFMNTDEDFQECIMTCYKEWKEKRNVLHKVDA